MKKEVMDLAGAQYLLAQQVTELSGQQLAKTLSEALDARVDYNSRSGKYTWYPSLFKEREK